MTTPREEFFRALTADDPLYVLWPTLSCALFAAVFALAFVSFMARGRRLADQRMAALPLEDEAPRTVSPQASGDLP